METLNDAALSKNSDVYVEISRQLLPQGQCKVEAILAIFPFLVTTASKNLQLLAYHAIVLVKLGRSLFQDSGLLVQANLRVAFRATFRMSRTTLLSIFAV